jgi:DNA-binding beta-propeller fold protein YncE
VGGDGVGGQGGGGIVDLLARSSKSSTIDICPNDTLVAMVNSEHDSVSVFSTSTHARLCSADVAPVPSSVVFSPDCSTLYVASRTGPSLTKITDADTPTPTASAFNAAAVGCEPTGVALSPTGKYLGVAEWCEGSVSVWDTSDGSLVERVAVPSPRAIAITNDGDDEDDDELLVVPEFYGAPNDGVAGSTGPETRDDGRLGRVHTFTLPALIHLDTITLAPRDSGMLAATGAWPNQVITSAGAGEGVQVSPNQLWAVAVVGYQIYIPAIAVSPSGPPNVGANVQPVIYAADLVTGLEDTSSAGTTNLARLVIDKTFTLNTAKLYLADIVDVSFVGSDLAFVLSRGADVLQRVDYASGTVAIGAAGKPEQIDLAAGANPCRVPTGVVTSHDGTKAYLNCSYDRDLGVVDLATDSVTTTSVSSPDPLPGSDDETINDGYRAFFTGRGRWSQDSYSACASCHPDGLSDNVTWVFGSGPRQSVSLDGAFSKSDSKQRVFNWAGIFDEMHDYERFARDVSGGVGSIASAASLAECATDEVIVGFTAGGLQKPLKEINDALAVRCNDDWDDIAAWVKTVRPPKARQLLDPVDVDAGAALLVDGKCHYCHGGSGFTLSRLFWVPDGDDGVVNLSSALALQATFPQPTDWPASWSYDVITHIRPQPAPIPDDGTGPIEPGPIGPERVVCVVRNVGTFGKQGDPVLTDAIEVNALGARALGRGGYNIPSLYGLSTSAPYLHHGQARSLEELLTDPAWLDHLQAAEPAFAPDATEVSQLVSYLLAIDGGAAEVPPPTQPTFKADGCPSSFGTPD